MTSDARPDGPEQTLRPRERVLAVATRLFLEEGIRAVGVDRIVDEAGAALMTLYRHFGNKDGLIVAALEQWSAGSVGWLADEVDRCGDDPEARFSRLWDALERRLGGEDGGSLVVIAAVELRRAPGHPAWKAIAEHRTAVRQLLEDLVKPLEVADPPAVAARLQLLVEGAEAAAVAGGPVGGLDLQASAEALLGGPPHGPPFHDTSSPPGGCLTTRITTHREHQTEITAGSAAILGFTAREELRRALEERSDGRLQLDPEPR